MTDNAELFKNIPKKELKIDHPKIFDFTIKGKIDAINGSGTENVKSILSSEDNPFTDPIKFNFLIKKLRNYGILEHLFHICMYVSTFIIRNVNGGLRR